jgi:hypothetical protein
MRRARRRFDGRARFVLEEIVVETEQGRGAFSGWADRGARIETMHIGDALGFGRYDTTASGNWYKADEPWGAFLQTDGNPAVTVSPYESDPSSGSFNPQAHTTWVPVDWNSWPNYNVHGYGIY